jgi:hypothetical protein
MKLILNVRDFPDLTASNVEDMLGVLPYWVAQYNILHAEGWHIVEFMTECYGFGGHLYRFKGEVLPNGTYRHKGDPDMPYVARMNTPSGNVYFYEYAMLALPLPNGEYFVSRMD